MDDVHVLDPEDLDPDVIYLDYSTLSSFQTCREKCRLAYVEHLRPADESPALSFGSAFHRGAAGWHRGGGLDGARKEFLVELQDRKTALPLSIESDEKRSIERGLYLLDAYMEKYANEPYENIVRPDTGTPYVEIGFAIYLMDWKGKSVMYVGHIDRIARSKIDGRVYNMEKKTTSMGLSQFVLQTRPNHQVTGYHLGAQAMGLDVAGTIWDCIFISSRQPNAKAKAPDGASPRWGYWMQYGIDIDKDFARAETRRSPIDMEEFLFDMRTIASDYLQYKDSGAHRWPRNAPTACGMYGGCQFKEICSTNVNPQVISSLFRVERWDPWKAIRDRSAART